MLRLLRAASIEAVKYSAIEPDPDCGGVDEAAELARAEGCTSVVAVGGGSALDFGKGVAVMAANPGNCWSVHPAAGPHPPGRGGGDPAGDRACPPRRGPARR